MAKGILYSFAFLVICIFLSLVLVARCEGAERYLGFGGYTYNGHSDSGGDKIDPPGQDAFGGVLRFEDGRDVQNWAGDMTYGASLSVFSFVKRDNHTGKEERQYSVAPMYEMTAYLRLAYGFSAFIGVGAGFEFATDQIRPAVMPRYGLEKTFTAFGEDFAAEVFWAYVYTPTRRHDMYGFAIKYSF